MKSARLVLCAALLAGVAACTSPQELRRQDEARCAGYGFQPGTDDFATCLQRESLARRYANAYLLGPPRLWHW